MNGASSRNTNRHLGQVPHQARRLLSSRWKARLQLVNAEWYAVSVANRRMIASSVSGRSSDTYVDAGADEPCPRSSASNASPLDHWWLTS